ncbi:DNA repair protein RecN [Oceanomicrobium pacificus]|uniref:DNA repair protein RecN n=1 Tax=Oceanomicrobium pacificus TaxID=2692916 RepID=A0A6B0TUH9_9RHOB|nr:DNA repair protein RecN [Oceanomicrobium pacificus]MXU65435.1 DNA repair protein RecN [Oceanomicrobium pacificus]
MLLSLSVRDILLIDRLDLDFAPGLNTLTGETGAGKSILLDCLGFVLGQRGRAELVRSGAERGEVTAEFSLSPSHPARALLEEAGFDPDDTLLIRRVNGADGRKRAFINDAPASGPLLRQLGETLVEIHGQQDDRGLLNPRGHRDLLDAYGGLGAKVEAARTAWRALAEAKKTRDTEAAAIAAAQADEDYLRHTARELAEFDPQPGEEEELDRNRALMKAADRIREDVSRAEQALGREGAEGQMHDALRWLDAIAGDAAGALDEPMAALTRALTELGEAQAGIEAMLGGLDADPLALERLEDRLFTLRGLARKHNVLADELPALNNTLQARLSAVEESGTTLAALDAAVEDATAAYTVAATALTEARQKAAAKLDRAVARELAPLKLDKARFETRITPIEDGQSGQAGQDQVVFTVATNPGAPAGALNQIASGGELSRFLLALKACLTARQPDQTLIFDEIDRGVGGATADAVGRKLAALAEGGQVLVVTHSPQVAARAGHHWRVAKTTKAGQTLTAVTTLGAEARVDEIARMLAGETITDAARAAARELLGAGATVT